jgi:hypothetical protein
MDDLNPARMAIEIAMLPNPKARVFLKELLHFARLLGIRPGGRARRRTARRSIPRSRLRRSKTAA